MNQVILIIPAFNEEKNIQTVVENLMRNYPDLDYVVVNDGSTDGTEQILREGGYNHITLPVNLGLAGCFQTGMKYACERGYSYAVQFDGDGQHRAEYVSEMKEKMDEGYSIVIGSRFVEQRKDFSLRMVGSRMNGLAIWLTTGARVTDPTSGMRMFDREMMEKFAYRMNYGPEPDTISLLIHQGAKVAEVPVVIDERKGGESYLKPGVAVKYMLRMLTSILVIQNFRGRG